MEGVVVVAVLKAAWDALIGPVVTTLAAEYVVRRIRRRRLAGHGGPAGAVR
ncbi:MAG TPA: hypothetical protein VD866_08825 [Urbifossiella sp.]|nr:hypothetical protein [Urbifossiella sp.]